MNSTIEKKDHIKEWESHFDLFSQSVSASETEAVQQVRKSALERFKLLGFPTTRDEEWKYSSVKNLLEKDFAPVLLPSSLSLTKEEIDKLEIPKISNDRIVLVNGFFDEALSTISEHQGVRIVHWNEAASETGLHHTLDPEADAFECLNAAFASDGLYISANKSKAVSSPVHLVIISDTRNSNPQYFVRNLINAEENSELDIIISFKTIGQGQSLVNVVNEIDAGKNAKVRVNTLQDDNGESSIYYSNRIAQNENSVVHKGTFSFGSDWIRNNLQFAHTGTHCESHLIGLYLLSGDQHVDNHTRVDHAQPDCFSNELYKGVLDGDSTGVFNGKVFVHPDAQKTNAFQSNRNILLSPTATINTKPQLEIFADDVKCSHGATTGQLDKEALFYLRGRGIPLNKANALLTKAFAAEVIDELKKDTFAEYLEHRIEEVLHGRLS